MAGGVATGSKHRQIPSATHMGWGSVKTALNWSWNKIDAVAIPSATYGYDICHA